MTTLQEAVAYFLAERDDFIRAIDNCPATNMEDYWRWQGHAEARRVFREALERDGIDLMAEPRPEATVKAEAAEKIAEIAEEAADELDLPVMAEWLDQRDWFKAQLHALAAKAREAGESS